ncbi:MAG: hypothetical protein OHK0032_10960 [Thermodesulfovibrionales bacterium]
MRSQKSGVTSHKSGVRSKIILLCILLSVFCSLTAFSSEKWPGVDESVVERYAKEHGREAREPFINTDQGDLLLFVFLLAGAAGGFIAGYYWRTLTENRDQRPKSKLQVKGNK